MMGAVVAASVTGCGSDTVGDKAVSSEPDAVLTESEVISDDATTEPDVSASDISSAAQTTATQTTAAENPEYLAWGYVQTSSGGNANIRAKSSSDAEIIGSMKSDRLIRIYDRSSDKKWYKIKYKDTFGYILAGNVKVTKYAIIVYKGNQTVVVYQNGDLSAAKVFKCSSGRAGHETPTKNFTITTTIKGRVKDYTWRDLKGGVFGQYGTTISPYYLFHSMPYKNKGKNDSMDKSGYEALLQGQADSDGCIRLCVRDAKWIFEKCDRFTTVQIVDGKTDKETTEEYPSLKKGINADGVSYGGWDPTDPDENNPYKAD